MGKDGTGTVLGERTRVAYRRAFASFGAWLASVGMDGSLPVASEAVVAYVDALPRVLGRGAARLRIAAVADAHRTVGHPWDADHPAIRAALRRRAVDPAGLLRRLAGCGEDMAGLRDRAILLLGDGVGLLPSEIATLARDDVFFTTSNATLVVRSAWDPDGDGRPVVVARRRGDAACAVGALEAWLTCSGIAYGAVARAVANHGWPGASLGTEGVRRVLRTIGARASIRAPEGKMPVPGAWRTGTARKGSVEGKSGSVARGYARKRGRVVPAVRP